MSLLLVDDDEIFSERLALAFRDRGRTVYLAHGYHQALELARTHQPSQAVLDLRMPGPNGLALLRALRDLLPDIEVVMLTGYGSIASTVDAMRLGAVNFLAKPADADMILAAFERARAEPLEEVEVDYQPPSLARAEWEHIQRVLSDCGGNISQAARMLGLHRRTLQRKLSQYPPQR